MIVRWTSTDARVREAGGLNFSKFDHRASVLCSCARIYRTTAVD